MRKNMKRILALGLTGLLTAGLLTGSVEYAGHTFAVDAMAASVSSTEKVKTSESGGLDKEDVSKQETVYVNTDAAGQVKDVVVSDWLKNSGINGTVKDVSDLTDIENVKGDEKFTQSGDSLTWNTGDKDIYYQGKTDKNLPVSMNITYKLDGKETAPKDLIGKSGKVEMTIKYTNHSKQTVSLGGKQTDIYTPFMMVTGMILPVDKFENVTIDNGTLVSEGDNDVVVAYGFPGLAESLDLDNLDFGDDMDIDTSKISDKITDTVTIKADVKNFEMNSTYTVATNQLFNELDFDKIDDMDDFTDKIDDLTDASSQLVNGSKKLHEGTEKLSDSFSEYADAVKTAKDGVGTLKDGAGTLKTGIVSYTKGTDKLLNGVTTYVKGAKTLSKGVQAYTTGTSQLVDAIGQLRTATKDLPAQYEKLGSGVDTYVASVNKLLAKDNMDQMTTGTKSLKEGIGQLDDGLGQAQQGIASLNAAANKLKKTDELDQCVAGLEAMEKQYEAAAAAGDASAKQAAAALQGAIQYIQGGEQVADAVDAATNGKADGDADKNGQTDLAVALATMKAATDKTATGQNLYTGAASLETAAGTMSGYASQLCDSSKALTDGNAQMKAGVTQLSDSINQMNTAAGTLTDNNKALNDGASGLIKNASTITKGAKKLTGNSSKLRKGAVQLQQGTGTLFAGMTKLVNATGAVSDGISSLNDGASTLENGMNEFDKQGISKIADAVTEMLDSADDLNDRLSKISSISGDYTSFSGNADGMDGSVKFIMATEELTADED